MTKQRVIFADAGSLTLFGAWFVNMAPTWTTMVIGAYWTVKLWDLLKERAKRKHLVCDVAETCEHRKVA